VQKSEAIISLLLGLGAAVFTAAGLYFYSILLSRTRGHLARILSLPLSYYAVERPVLKLKRH
jgi:hypothetical protein